ncbi:hypothetical protein [Rudaeicoccus suwonensis]|uniref:Uncharacterized protein n=1 Tax=Rudaeicoccus suwonensis TaxID=657409 RepID=A0A561ECD4_9MICO|nr:hypothetical protein [Rudaeicoccus suwonensis]TWE13259.1 hypothetical protein BKA23_2088 [Rudaeicoccus suwonensis]
MKGHVAIYDPGEDARNVAVRGYVGQLLAVQRIPAMRDRANQCSWVRRERLDELLGVLETSGYKVRLIAGDPR